MATISHTVTLPDGSTPASIYVKFELIANPPTTPMTSPYITSSGVVVEGVSETTSTNGSWSVTLTNNSLITPANTYYQVTHVIAGRTYVDAIRAVGASGTFASMLITPPSPLATTSDINALISGRSGLLVAETAGVTKSLRWYNRASKTVYISGLYAAVDGAPTGSGITVTVWKNGSSAGAQTVTIGANSNTGSTTGLAIPVLVGDFLQAWPTAVGSTTPGSDLTVAAGGTY